MFQPLSFCLGLVLQKSYGFACPLVEGHGFSDGGKSLCSPLEPFCPQVENLRPVFLAEHAEQADAQAKGIARSGVFFRESSEPREEGLFALRCEGVQFAGLSTLSRRFSTTDPGCGDESFEKGIDEVVVHRAVAGDRTDAVFEGVTVLRAVEEASEDQ